MAEQIKLGRMEPDWGYPEVAAASESKKKVERFPSVYIRLDTLPDLKPGQEVILRGVVTSFEDKKVRKMDGGKEEIITHREAEIDILTMEEGAIKAPADPPTPADDLDTIKKGLDAAQSDDDEDDDEDDEGED